MSFLLIQSLSGLAAGSVLFLIASGLSIIFGVTRIVNFAHGSLTMVGAYLAGTLVALLPPTPLGFWGALGLSALAVGLLGVVLERLVLRPLYRSPELFPLLATFGVVLMVADATLALWGPEDLLGPRAPGLAGTVRIMGQPFPVYDLVLIGLGPVVLAGLLLLFHGTRWGAAVRAATEDREMAAALGIVPERLFAGVFFLGSALAGLGGALQLPREAISLSLDLASVIEAFVVVVIGGMGSLGGAFVAALLIGQVQAFGIVLWPQITLVLVFLVMALVLIVRPQGLFGRRESPSAAQVLRRDEAVALVPGRWGELGFWLAGGLLALAPWGLGDYPLLVLTEILILALFAASLHLLLGLGGLVSFGHAAFFGLGAYAAALAASRAGLPMLACLALAPLAGAVGAAVIGWFVVRLDGVYSAMLTLAAAQILWSLASQWVSLTGGDNGLLGLWPAPWAASRGAYFELTLGLVGAGLWLVRRLAAAPFGYALRAARDSERRAAAVGIPVRLVRWRAYVIAGALAGLAGGLVVFARGSLFPAVLAVPTSVDALLMVLLGGLGTLAGPVLGAAAFHGLEIGLMPLTQYWRAALGLMIVLLVLACPQGLGGVLQRLGIRLRGGRS